MSSSSTEATASTAREYRNRPLRNEFLIFGSPLVGEEEIQEVVSALRTGWIGTGPRAAQFEHDMRNYTGAKYSVAVNSCTAALHLSILALGIGPGDEVITTPMTFAATANAVIHTGAKPVFVDADRTTMLMDPDRIEAAITPRTRAILPIHFAGRPCAMNEIIAIARKHSLYVIEDAAHCIEGRYEGQRVGNIGDLTCFSFYVTKNLTTAEGGMVTTNSKELADRIRVLALHGMSMDAYQRFSEKGYKHYEVVAPGFKYNMPDILAAMGIHQLKRIESSLHRREEIWDRYQDAFSALPVHLPAPPEANTRHARHLYTLLLFQEECGKSRDDVLNLLNKKKIGTGVHYTPVHLHPYYRKTFGYTEGMFPNSEWIGDGTLSLPLSAKLRDQDVDDVIGAVHDVISG